jgi:hypothetical protein
VIFLKTDSTRGAVSRWPEAFLIAAARLGVETRAVNRALRKAYGIGLCSVEELGAFSSPSTPSTAPSPPNVANPSNGSGNGQPRLRDQLCLLVRQYNLDPNLVKALRRGLLRHGSAERSQSGIGRVLHAN